MERLSYSQLNSFTTCGESYRLERVIRVPRRPGWALVGGSAVHEITEQNDLREHGVDVPLVTFEEAFERLTAEAEEESGLPRSEFKASGRASKANPNKEDRDWWLAEGPLMVNRWLNWRRSSPWDIWITPQGKPAIELEFDVFVDNDSVDVKMFVDRVFTDGASLIVLDLKTGASKQPTARQLGVYKVGILDKWPGLPVRFGTFWDARSGATGPVYPLNEYSLRRLEWQFAALKEARRQNLYLPSPGPMCGSCSVNEHCYEYNPEATARIRPPWVSVEEWEGDAA